MQRKTLYEDADYAILFQQGDEKALSFFYREFHAALTLFASKWIKDRESCEEIASNAFIKTWKFHSKLDTYPAIRAYLYRTVRNECYDILRVKREKFIYKDISPLIITNDTAFDNLVRSEVSRILHTALKELSPGSCKVLTMHYLEEKSTSEIASELNLSKHTVRTQKARGLKSLRKILVRPLLFSTLLFLKILFTFL